jgi:hypothetical protein
MSYLKKYPKIIAFFCQTPAFDGGELILNETKNIKNNLSREILNFFKGQSIKYTRYFPSQYTMPFEGYGVSWQQIFATGDKKKVEIWCKKKKWEFQWQDDALIAKYNMPVFSENGLWFNQMTELHHSYWDEHELYKAHNLSADTYPADVRYENGDPIPTYMVAEIRGALWQSSFGTRMTQGDLIIVDNERYQHGRMFFSGKRKHYVALLN